MHVTSRNPQSSDRPVYESLTEQVMATIRREIGEQVLVPEELYSGYQIAERLGVSRSPVREALVRLAEDGVVQMARNRGFYVSRPLPQDIVEIFALRLALEVQASGRAAELCSDASKRRLQALFEDMARAAAEGDVTAFQTRDEELHKAILEIDENQRQIKIIDRLREETSLLGAKTFNRDRSLNEIQAEHGPIVKAITAGDAKAARSAMRTHLLKTGLILLDRVETESGQTVPRTLGSENTAMPTSWL